MILAIFAAQLRSMRLFRLGSSRIAMFSLAVAALWYGFWTSAAVFFFRLISEVSSPPLLAIWIPAGALAVCAYWQIAPMVTASFGASLDLRKLLVYPIPRGKLFTVEALLRLSTAVEMLLVICGGAAGLVANGTVGGPSSLPRVAAAVLLFVAFNLLLAAGLRSLIDRLLARKRVREVFILLLVLVSALPRLLMAAGVRYEAFERAFTPATSGAWPWSAAAHLALGAGAGQAALALVLWCAVAWVFARRQFDRSLRFDAQAAAATPASPGGAPWLDRLYRLPGAILPDPLAAIVEKELRSLGRAPRFRTVFIMGFTFGLLVWLPLIIGRGQGRNSTVSDNFLVIVSLYAFTLLGQVSYWNSFGFDRTAAQSWFVLPAPLASTLVGKNIAAALFIVLEVAAVTCACLLAQVPIPPARMLEAFLVTPIAALYMLALGNLSSVHFPRPMNPERASQGGAASRFQGLLFLLYPLALLPVLMAYLARWAFSSAAAFYAVLAFAAALGAAVYWIAMESAVQAARRRREAFLADLSKGEGPVVSE